MKNGKRNPGITGLHLGKIVADKMMELRINKAELTRKMRRNHQSIISALFKRPSMQTYLVWELSIALKYDFFGYLSEQIMQKAGGQIISNNIMAQQKIAELEKQTEALRQENTVLRKAVEALAK